MNQFKLRAVVAAVAGVALFGLAATAQADSADDLLKKLRDKGVLTEQEYDEFNNTRDTEKAKKSSEIKASFKDGISWESGDKQHAMALTGRVHFDYRDVNGYNEMRDTDTATMADQFELRRARIGVKGRLYNSYEYEIVTNAVGSNANLVDTAFMNINWWDQAQFRLGRFKQPFSLEEQTSSNNIDFSERSFVNSLVPGKQLGAMVHGEIVKGLNYGLSRYQSGFSDTDNSTDNDSEIGGRVTANIAQFAGWSDAVLHIGLAASDGTYGLVPAQSNNTSKAVDGKTRATIYSFRSEARGLNNIYRAQIGGETLPATQRIFGATTGVAAEVDKKLRGLELVAAYGPVKLQGEYIKAEFDADYASGPSAAAAASTRVNAEAKAWYAEALWMLTGEKYSDFYKGGAFGTIKPKNDFIHPSIASSSGGWGAWELGLRYSNFDTKYSDNGGNSRQQGSRDSDHGSDGGAKSYTAGIKWIVNPNMRFMLNYVQTKFDYALAPIDVDGYVGTEDKERSLQLRGQIAF